MVLANDYRHPVVVAKEAATLDVLTGGRFELGIGAGWMTADYEAAGIPLEAAGLRVDRLAEAIARAARAAGRTAPSRIDGEHYRIDGLDGPPGPADTRGTARS